MSVCCICAETFSSPSLIKKTDRQTERRMDQNDKQGGKNAGRKKFNKYTKQQQKSSMWIYLFFNYTDQIDITFRERIKDNNFREKYLITLLNKRIIDLCIQKNV